MYERSAAIVAAMLLLSAGLSACSEEKSAAQAAPPPPPQVTVAKPIKKVVSDYDEYVGRFVASATTASGFSLAASHAVS